MALIVFRKTLLPEVKPFFFNHEALRQLAGAAENQSIPAEKRPGPVAEHSAAVGDPVRVRVRPAVASQPADHYAVRQDLGGTSPARAAPALPGTGEWWSSRFYVTAPSSGQRQLAPMQEIEIRWFNLAFSVEVVVLWLCYF